jgi:hypothetical protein
MPRQVKDREKLPKFLEQLRSEVLLPGNLQSSTNVVLDFVVEVGGGGNELSFLLDVVQYQRFGTSLLQEAPAEDTLSVADNTVGVWRRSADVCENPLTA